MEALPTAQGTLRHHLCVFGVPNDKQIAAEELAEAQEQVEAEEQNRLVSKLKEERPDSVIGVEWKPMMTKPKADLNDMD